jgi:hypothetical protein
MMAGVNSTHTPWRRAAKVKVREAENDSGNGLRKRLPKLFGQSLRDRNNMRS